MCVKDFTVATVLISVSSSSTQHDWSSKSLICVCLMCNCCRNNAVFSCQFSGEQHTRVHERKPEGFLERLSASTGGVIAGVCLFALSIYVLFTNEVRVSQSFSQSVSLSVNHLPVLCVRRVARCARAHLWMRVSLRSSLSIQTWCWTLRITIAWFTWPEPCRPHR